MKQAVGMSDVMERVKGCLPILVHRHTYEIGPMCDLGLSSAFIPKYQIEVYEMVMQVYVTEEAHIIVDVGVEVRHTAGILLRQVHLLQLTLNTWGYASDASYVTRNHMHLLVRSQQSEQGSTIVKFPASLPGLAYLKCSLQSALCLYIHNADNVASTELEHYMHLFDVHAENMFGSLIGAVNSTHEHMHCKHPEERHIKYQKPRGVGSFVWSCGMCVRGEEVDMIVKRFVEGIN
jgi:hypothetical protein